MITSSGINEMQEALVLRKTKSTYPRYLPRRHACAYGYGINVTRRLTVVGKALSPCRILLRPLPLLKTGLLVACEAGRR